MTTLHVLGLPHTELTPAWEVCAFTARTRVFARMMAAAGWAVVAYGGEESDVAPARHVTIVTRAEQDAWFPGYDPTTTVWNDFGRDRPHWISFNERCVGAIRERMAPGDILCLSMGWSQWPVAEALPELTPVEIGIGYSGVVAPFRVHESYAHAHYLAGKKNPTDDARFYDTVIPRPYEIADFPAGTGSGGYALMLTRFIRRKGIEIAVEATRRAGVELVIAGQGVERDGNTYRGQDITVRGDHIRHVGLVDATERARLLGDALCLMAPTMYLGPFEGVHVEAQLTGTPVVTTDWGVFVETVTNGVNGYRCNLLREFAAAIPACADLDRDRIRADAQARFGTDTVAAQYAAYFDRLATLRLEGWYAA